MINIAKLLKNYPKGTKLYSPLFGEVEFAEVMNTDYVPIRVMKRGYGLRFDEYGRYMGNEYPDSECLLFPSKDCRTWEGWKLPVEPKFKVGDWVANDYCAGKVIALTDDAYLLDSGQGIPFSCEHNAHLWTIQDAKDGDVLVDEYTDTIGIFEDTNEIYWHSKIYCGKSTHTKVYHHGGSHHIKLTKPATKEQRDLLFAKMREAGYEWDADKKELRKIQHHYDISNFHAGMPVLVRETSLNAWQYVLFSHCYTGGDGLTRFNAGLVGFTQCIPFNDDTKHLLGTTDMPDEEYISW